MYDDDNVDDDDGDDFLPFTSVSRFVAERELLFVRDRKHWYASTILSIKFDNFSGLLINLRKITSHFFARHCPNK